MKARKLIWISLICVAGLLAAALLLLAGLFLRRAVMDGRINDDYSAVLRDPALQSPVYVEGVGFITQEVSCGYACIEMLAGWQGADISEESLLRQNEGAISTAMGTGFLEEMGRQFPEWQTARHTELANSELLRTVHSSLAGGMPVPVEFAAPLATEAGTVWTLHFAVVTGMDLAGDAITVQNPYGYQETYTVDDFLRATRYDSYEDMEIPFRLGFAAGLFCKNTVYTIQTGQAV